MKLKWFFVPAFLVICSILAFFVIVYYNISQLVMALNQKKTEPARAARWVKDEVKEEVKINGDEVKET